MLTIAPSEEEEELHAACSTASETSLLPNYCTFSNLINTNNLNLSALEDDLHSDFFCPLLEGDLVGLGI